MTSSMLTGERRWASARRGGKISLGKIVVPKPINLPSQRLENHGLDPNVEIVPKGTLGWGNRSSSVSNAWSSSTQSPNADGGAGSPSFLNGRPSSGGSGTRPSTASSDRAHEPTNNAWGPNSRPSSASGALTSNQTSPISLRPRSAETRPGSSQLSRFAESIPENSVAWTQAGTAEKLGVISSKNDGFSLTSGDFPTLGSEKDNSGKNSEAQGDDTVTANVKAGSSNSWKRDNSSFSDSGARSNVEKWQGDPQPYPNVSIPPHHYDAWHGPPVNNPPGGGWYRGPPGGPPYGTPLAPGGFPLEPFPYYRPQIPVTSLANPQPVSPPGAGPRGYHPKNGDMYRPHRPDAYIRPAMPIRPGFYPGPVAYEGYYCPPMGYCNPSERDIPFIGMQAGPGAYNRYPSQNAPNHGNSHRSGGSDSADKALVSEQVEHGHHHDSRGPYKVLLRQHNRWDGKEEERKWEDTVMIDASHREKGDQPRTSSWDEDWRADYRNNVEIDVGMARGEEVSSQSFENQAGSSSIPVKVKLPETLGHGEHASSAFLEGPSQTFSSTPNDSSPIHKIEGLNTKAENAKASQSANKAGTGSLHNKRTHADGILSSASHEFGVSAGDKSLELTTASGTAIYRRSTHGMQSRAETHGKGRSNTQGGEGRRKKYPVSDASSIVSVVQLEASASVQVQDHYTSAEATEKNASYLMGKDEVESALPMVDPNDCQAQHSKMRELAMQCVKQLQKEEEERTRKQKAKALEKLEELNRRTQGAEASIQKLENVRTGALQNKQEESLVLSEPVILASEGGAPNSTLASNQNVVQNNKNGATRVEKSSILSNELPVYTLKSTHKEPVVAHNNTLPFQQDVNSADAVQHINSPHVCDGNVSKQKRMDYKPKQNFPSEKNLAEKFLSTSTTEVLKSLTDVADNASAVLEVAANEIASTCGPNVMAEPLVHQRRKNNRSGKSKQRVEEASSMAVLPPEVSKEANVADASVDSGKLKASESELDPSSIQSSTVFKDSIQTSDQQLSLPNEEAHVRVNNQWKSQHARRTPRNPQVNKTADKFNCSDTVMWAPVRSNSKTDVIDEGSHKNEPEAATPFVKSDHTEQNNPRNKRAEMERYVPKPVAKEMAQQGSIPQPVSPVINQTASVETVGKVNSGSQGTESNQSASSAIGKVGFAMESKNGGSKQNKHGGAHGSWRQRGATESTSMHGLQDRHSSSPNRKSVEYQHPQNPNVSSVKEQPKYSDEWNASDEWNMPENFDSVTPATTHFAKDKGVTGRGKRHPSKGHRGIGNNHDLDHKKIDSGDTDKTNAQSSVSESSQTNLAAASKEFRGVGERSTSHWQPKSKAISATNQRGSRPLFGQNVGIEVGRSNKNELSVDGGLLLSSQHEKRMSGAMPHPHHDQSISEKVNVEEAPNTRRQEARRERKGASLKGHPHSPNQGHVSPVEPAPASTDVRREQHPSSGSRNNENPKNHFGRGQESHGDWSSSDQDSRQHSLTANRDKQRHNLHCEYQPVGTFNSNKPNNFGGPKDGSHTTGPRFRERGQSHSRRGGGNFYGRQSGTVRVDASYE